MGIPQLSMHSIREMCGTDDVGIAYRHFSAFFKVSSSPLQSAIQHACSCGVTSCGANNRTPVQDISSLDRTLDVDSLPPPSLRGTINDPACHHTHTPRGPLIDVPTAGSSKP